MTTLPGRYDIIFQQGVTYDLPIAYRDLSGNAIDLTDYSARMQIRELPTFPVLVEFNSALTANGFVLLNGAAEDREDGANGNLRLFMTAANSANISAIVARYQLNIIDVEGYVTPLLEGRFEIQGSVTV